MGENETRVFCRHQRRRQQFFTKYKTVWPGTLRGVDSYDLLDSFVINQQELEATLDAASAIARIYKRISDLIEHAPNAALLELGLPRDACKLARTRIAGLDDPVVGRLDLVKAGPSYKMLEFNVDAPGLLLETFSINAAACHEAGEHDVNLGSERRLIDLLSKAIYAGMRHSGKDTTDAPFVAVAANSKYLRDKDTAEYLARHIRNKTGYLCEFLPVEKLETDSRGLYDTSGRQIDVLLRAFPMMYLCRGAVRKRFVNDGSYLTYEDLRLLICGGQLAVINSPFTLALESKAVQAAIWGLMKDGNYFSQMETNLIVKHFIPTFLDRPADSRAFVVKPMFGNNGDSIRIFDSLKNEIDRSRDSTYADFAMVYQDYLNIPEAEFVTGDGRMKLKMVWSCFIVNWRAFGVTLRVGNGVTDSSWWVVPVALETRH
jgi:glutathionylspermidine synthase